MFRTVYALAQRLEGTVDKAAKQQQQQQGSPPPGAGAAAASGGGAGDAAGGGANPAVAEVLAAHRRWDLATPLQGAMLQVGGVGWGTGVPDAGQGWVHRWVMAPTHGVSCRRLPGNISKALGTALPGSSRAANAPGKQAICSCTHRPVVVPSLSSTLLVARLTEPN